MRRSIEFTTYLIIMLITFSFPQFISDAAAEKKPVPKIKVGNVLIVISAAGRDGLKNDFRGLADSAEFMLSEELSKRGMTVTTSQELPPHLRDAARTLDMTQLFEYAKKNSVEALITGTLSAERNEVRPMGLSLIKTTAELRAKLYNRDGQVRKSYQIVDRASAPDSLQADHDMLQSLVAQVMKQSDIKNLASISASNQQVVVVSNSPRDDLFATPMLNEKPLENDLALVIGIENYRSLPKSEYSVRDAELVRSHLLSLGFQQRNIELLLNERATKSDIEKALQAWLPNRHKSGAKVLIYFSGHGAPEPKSGESYLVPYDGDPNYLEVTGIKLRSLYESLGKLNTRQVVVVLDSCFSGSGGRSVLAKGAKSIMITKEQGQIPSSLAILTATGQNQISTSSPELHTGVLTYHFLKALRQGNRKMSDILTYVQPRVEDDAKSLNVLQTPHLFTGSGRRPDEYQLGH